MWQKCPICKGTGKEEVYNSSIMNTICKTCNGCKIINELTGLPPNNSFVTTNASTNIGRDTNVNNMNEDFRDRNMESQQEYFGK